jgi:8-oxo-dGTP pyrophosphatase MutT (NUDIX family)
MTPEPKHDELHRIALTAIIYNDEGQYLITQRSKDKTAFPGMWTVPGGGLEVDDYIHDEPTTSEGQWYEAIEKALRREIDEEVGLEVGELEYLTDIAFIRDDGIPVVILSYYCQHESGAVSLDEDSIDFAWIDAEEVGEYDLIEGIDEEIQMVNNSIKG